MTDRFVPTQKEEHTEIFELTFRENYCDGQPETPERVERFKVSQQWEIKLISPCLAEFNWQLLRIFGMSTHDTTNF